MDKNMGNDEWIEIAPLWKPRTEGSRLLAKGIIEKDLKAGQKILILHNQYATEENRQPQFRLMIVEEGEEGSDQTICLRCGESLHYSDIEQGNSYHDSCHEEERQMAIDEKEVNPHGMG